MKKKNKGENFVKVKCIDCLSDNVRYVSASIEYHYVDAVDMDSRTVELSGMDEAYPDETFDEHFLCLDCDREFPLEDFQCFMDEDEGEEEEV